MMSVVPTLKTLCQHDPERYEVRECNLEGEGEERKRYEEEGWKNRGVRIT